MKEKASFNTLPTGTILLKQYRIEHILGQGGFGITYLANDIRLNQHVAIKEFLPSELAARDKNKSIHPKSIKQEESFEKFKKRFLREAQTLARFKHPNMARVQNYFEENGTAYFVMEYEEGESLGNLLKEKIQFSKAEILNFLIPLLEGLAIVHDSGIIHRDIKPDNIYLRTDGSPVLLDFGAASYVSGQSKTVTTLLTPGYAPFEQYLSDAKEQGPWTDIYSLGAVVYQAITGIIPTESSRRYYALSEQHDDPLPSVTELGKPHFDDAFLYAIEQSLLVKSKDRPQSAKQWMAMLLNDTIYNQAHQSQTKTKTNNNNSKYPTKWILSIALSILLMIGLTSTYWLIQPGHLRIVTNVPNVAVYLSNNKVGQTNARGRLKIPDAGKGKIRIEMKKEGYQTHRAYIHIIKGKWITKKFKLHPLKAKLFVRSNAKNSTVWINDQYFGQADKDWSLKPGIYSVVVKSEGYKNWQQKVQLKPDANLELFASLQQKSLPQAKNNTAPSITTGTIEISTNPAQAKWFLNETYIGLTPGQQTIKAGKYDLHAMLPGYKKWHQSIEIRKGKTIQINIPFEPTVYSLSIDVIPENANIKIMNIKQQYFPGMLLKSGKYKIKITQKNHKPWHRWIAIDDSNKHIDIKLTPITKQLKPTMTSTNPAPDPSENDQEISSLLAKFNKIINRRRITTIGLKKAYRHCQKLSKLKFKDNNTVSCLNRIGNAFAKLAENALNKNEIIDSKKIVRQGLRLMPNHEELKQINTKLQQRTQIKKPPKQKRVQIPLIF